LETSYGNQSEYGINREELPDFKGRVYVPNQLAIKELMLDEFHRNPYVSHLGYHKLFFA